MKIKILIITLALSLLTSCGMPPTPPVVAPVSTVNPQVEIANPASAFCVEQGFKSEIRTTADGSQSGFCVFPNGTECEEWAFFRGKCGQPQQRVNTPVVPTQIFTTSSGLVVTPQTVSMPAGVIVDPRNGTAGLTGGLIFYSPDGLTLGELLAPNAGKLHVTGRYQGSLNFPLLFHAFDMESQKQYLRVNGGHSATDPGGAVSDFTSLNDRAMLAGLVGVPAQSIIFYTVFEPVDSALQTQFIFGDMETLASALPIQTLESNESRYWKPVAIQMKDNIPNGLWFTREPWGIGGDIVFSHHEGLSYLDLASRTIHEALPTDTNFSSLSADQTWAAYSVRKDTGSEFFIRNLMGGDPILIPPLPESDRGAGDGIFSPSNKYIVWREAQGSLFDGNFHQTIRVATLDGQAVGNFIDTPFYKTAEIAEGTRIEPVGWLDDESILVQTVRAEKPHDGTLVALNVTTGQFTLFAQGFLAGWFYP